MGMFDLKEIVAKSGIMEKLEPEIKRYEQMAINTLTHFNNEIQDAKRDRKQILENQKMILEKLNLVSLGQTQLDLNVSKQLEAVTSDIKPAAEIGSGLNGDNFLTQ